MLEIILLIQNFSILNALLIKLMIICVGIKSVLAQLHNFLVNKKLWFFPLWGSSIQNKALVDHYWLHLPNSRLHLEVAHITQNLLIGLNPYL